MDMQTMELRYLDALHYTTYEIRDPQYQDSLTRILVEDFRAKYKSDAGPFALQGFDAGLYFLSKLWGYGPYLLDHLDAEQGISTGFDFKPVENGGQENQFLFLTQLKDFKMQRLKH